MRAFYSIVSIQHTALTEGWLYICVNQIKLKLVRPFKTIFFYASPFDIDCIDKELYDEILTLIDGTFRQLQIKYKTELIL